MKKFLIPANTKITVLDSKFSSSKEDRWFSMISEVDVIYDESDLIDNDLFTYLHVFKLPKNKRGYSRFWVHKTDIILLNDENEPVKSSEYKDI